MPPDVHQKGMLKYLFEELSSSRGFINTQLRSFRHSLKN